MVFCWFCSKFDLLVFLRLLDISLGQIYHIIFSFYILKSSTSLCQLRHSITHITPLIVLRHVAVAPLLVHGKQVLCIGVMHIFHKETSAVVEKGMKSLFLTQIKLHNLGILGKFWCLVLIIWCWQEICVTGGGQLHQIRRWAVKSNKVVGDGL